MRIVTLVENTTTNPQLEPMHGLSFYIETPNHRLLFDMGQTRLFLRNAHILGIDISSVDTAILSHGHYDHGGGLAAFLESNDHASIYLQKNAFAPHFSRRNDGKPAYIGLKKQLIGNPRYHYVDQEYQIDEELTLYSAIHNLEYPSPQNHTLYELQEDRYIQDSFCHEQNLLITAAGQTLLFAGCAHSGIVNIITQIEARSGRQIDAVFGGMHLKAPDSSTALSDDYLTAFATRLSTLHPHFYTCHCTGIEEYHKLKQILGPQITYLSTGTELHR